MTHDRPHAAVVYHPLKTNVDALADAVTYHEAAENYGPTMWYETSVDDAGTSAAQRAINDGASVVLASGGDGTIRAVSEALRGSGVPLAVIPQGTGNLLARNIGLPLNDIDEQVEAAFAGRDFKIDLGVVDLTREDGSVDSRVFLVLAGMGIDARVISATNQRLKKRVGWLAYVDAGLRTVVRERPLRISFEIDGGSTRSLRVFTVMMGNCGLLPGGVLLIPDAKMDDGKLDVVALKPQPRLGPLSWLRIFNKIGWENGVLRRSRAGRRMIDLVNDTKSVTYRQVETVSLSVKEPEPVQLDGDDFGRAVAVSTRVDSGALTLKVMRHWAPKLK